MEEGSQTVCFEDKMKTEVDDFLNQKIRPLPAFDELQKGLIGETKIERLKEESFVINSIFSGTTEKEILRLLRKKYPDEKFNIPDIKKFLAKNNQLMIQAKNNKSVVARRVLRARADVEEKLAGLILFTESLIRKYDSKDDSQSTVAALNVLNKTIMNYAKLAGFLEEREKKEVKNIINIISDKNARLAKEVISADFTMVDEDEEESDEQDSRV